MEGHSYIVTVRQEVSVERRREGGEGVGREKGGEVGREGVGKGEGVGREKGGSKGGRGYVPVQETSGRCERGWRRWRHPHPHPPTIDDEQS